MPQIIVDRNYLLQGADGKPFLADLFYTKGENKPVLVFLHGFKAFKDWGPWQKVAREFAENGFITITFNFSHNGTSIDHPESFVNKDLFSKWTISRDLKDIESVINWIYSKEFPAREFRGDKLFFVGHSRGGALAIIAGAEFNCHGIATWNAPAEFFSHWDKDLLEKWKKEGIIYIENKRTGEKLPYSYEVYLDFKNNEERYNPLKRIRELNVPVLIVHGDSDETVPVEDAFRLKEANPSVELQIIKGGTHTFGGKHPYEENDLVEPLKTVVRKTISFFKSL